jgi:hypothetical protein
MPSPQELDELRKKLVQETKEKAKQLAADKTPGKGPVVTGVVDPRFPKDGPFFANNKKGELPPDPTDLTKARIAAHEKDLTDGKVTPRGKDASRDQPGDHSEVSAADQALKNREEKTGRKATEEDLAELQAHNSNCKTADGGPKSKEELGNLKEGEPKRNKIPPGEGCPPRCDHCQGITGPRDSGPGMTMIGADGKPRDR